MPPKEKSEAIMCEESGVESPEGRERRYASALEHLKAFIDHVLEAFQVGSGIRNNAPEPITLDIARRLIWTELHRVFGMLDTADWGQRYLWVRLQAPETDGVSEIMTALGSAPSVAEASFRAYGPRKEDDPTVVYACIQLLKKYTCVPKGSAYCADPSQYTIDVSPITAAQAVLAHLWSRGISTRDIVLGTKA